MESTPSTRLRNTGLSLSAGTNVAVIAAGAAATPKPAITRHPEPVRPAAKVTGSGVGARALEALIITDSALRMIMVKALYSGTPLGDEISSLLMAASSASSAGIPGNCSHEEAHVRLDCARRTIQQFIVQDDGQVSCTACDGFMIDFTDDELICDTCGTTAQRQRQKAGAK